MKYNCSHLGPPDSDRNSDLLRPPRLAEIMKLEASAARGVDWAL
jgi:hypothetical protein